MVDLELSSGLHAALCSGHRDDLGLPLGNSFE